MAKTVTFGEIMMRLQPPDYKRFAQARQYDVEYGGAEANVAISLAGFGDEAYYVTRLPDNPIGGACLNELRRYGVDTSFVARGDGRLGIYFCEKGAAMRPSKVVYDRAGSAMAMAAPGDFDWHKIFDGAEWFHFTGITPALSDGCAALTLEAVKAAKEMGVTVSCDLNYRANLWSREKAGAVLSEIAPYVDVAFGFGREELENLFGMSLSDRYGGDPFGADKETAEKFTERFGFSMAVQTIRESTSASDNGLSGMLYDGKEFIFADHYDIHIVDRVGGGDAFAAGLIHGLLKGWDKRTALNFAVAAGALKHTVEGDFSITDEEEIKAIAAGNVSGRIQR